MVRSVVSPLLELLLPHELMTSGRAIRAATPKPINHALNFLIFISSSFFVVIDGGKIYDKTYKSKTTILFLSDNNIG